MRIAIECTAAAAAVGLNERMSGARAELLYLLLLLLLLLPAMLLEFATAAVADDAALLNSSRAVSTIALLPDTRLAASRDSECASSLLPLPLEAWPELPAEVLKSLAVEGRSALQI
jgi:hypothetical protein